MAVTFLRDRKAENANFLVFVVGAACANGQSLPDKRIAISKAALAEGTVTLEGERDREIAAAEVRIRNYEAAQRALQEFEE